MNGGHTAVFRWKKNESTWSSEIEVMDWDVAVLLRLQARKIQIEEVGIQCVRVKGNGSPPYWLHGGRERKYSSILLFS